MDARTRYTKRVIKNSFFELMKENPVSKITVKAISELAEINRGTFYKYYADPYDLMNQIEDELILSMQKLIETADNIDITQTLVIILNAIKENAEIYTLLISDNGDSTFFNRVIFESFQIKSDSLKDLLPNLSKTHHEWLYNFVTHGFTNIIITWVRNGMKEEPILVAEFINRLNNIVLEGLH